MKEQHQVTELIISGVAASPGIAIGRAFILKSIAIEPTGELLANESDFVKEIEKFDKAVRASVEEVELLQKSQSQALNDEAKEILETQIEFLTDPQIRSDVVEHITANRKNVVDAVINTIQKTVQVFKAMNDDYLRQRASDVQDIGNRILKNLNPLQGNAPGQLEENTIIIATDISPSEAMSMDLNRVIGFATQLGGKTSHTAILAKSKGLPAVLGCKDLLNSIQHGDLVIVDGLNGIVIPNPTDKHLVEYRITKEKEDKRNVFLKSLKNVPSQTSDGIKIELLANISSPEDMITSLECGAEGAGLFRTEMLFMKGNSFPSEEEQVEFYKQVVLKSKGKPVVVRTFDIGGDKPLNYFRWPEEENPFLGYRGIRVCLDRKDIFKIQLKAILRASVFGDLKIMFPMIGSVQELHLAKSILEEVKNELLENKVDFNKDIKVGMMIEVPSAAVIADILAKEVDFFSIGTNDLCQYTLAVDRGNEKINDLYDPYHPAVLRLISFVIEQGHKHGISVGMCGELASDTQATLLLLGMGLTEFSMSAVSIPSIKNIIINSNIHRAKEIWEEVKTMDNSKRIIDYLQTQK